MQTARITLYSRMKIKITPEQARIIFRYRTQDLHKIGYDSDIGLFYEVDEMDIEMSRLNV